MKITNIITVIILIIYLIIMYYLNSFYGLFKFILSLLIYTLIFYWLHYIWVNIRKKGLMIFTDFLIYFLNRVSIFLVFITILFWTLTYLSNEIYPAPMPEYTISNWTKTIKFQAMSHIWTKTFYNNIVSNIKEYKNKWWVYFYEWVKPGSEESLKKFNKAIWIEFDKNLYKNFSKLYWVINQDNRIFMWLVNDLDFNIDLNMDQIVKLYEEKTKNKKEYETKVPVDANKIIIETLSKLNEKELKILVYINQALLNFIISNESTQSFLTNNFANKDLFDVILWERNIIIKDAIINSEYNKIYMTYWLLHFKWVLKLLKEEDSKWKIIDTKNLYPIKN